MHEDIHVVAVGNRWVVKPDGSDAVSSHPKRDQAIEAGQALAQRAGGKLLIYDADGRVDEINPFQQGFGINP